MKPTMSIHLCELVETMHKLWHDSHSSFVVYEAILIDQVNHNFTVNNLPSKASTRTSFLGRYRVETCSGYFIVKLTAKGNHKGSQLVWPSYNPQTVPQSTTAISNHCLSTTQIDYIGIRRPGVCQDTRMCAPTSNKYLVYKVVLKLPRSGARLVKLVCVTLLLYLFILHWFCIDLQSFITLFPWWCYSFLFFLVLCMYSIPSLFSLV